MCNLKKSAITGITIGMFVGVSGVIAGIPLFIVILSGIALSVTTNVLSLYREERDGKDTMQTEY